MIWKKPLRHNRSSVTMLSNYTANTLFYQWLVSVDEKHFFKLPCLINYFRSILEVYKLSYGTVSRYGIKCVLAGYRWVRWRDSNWINALLQEAALYLVIWFLDWGSMLVSDIPAVPISEYLQERFTWYTDTNVRYAHKRM